LTTLPGTNRMRLLKGMAHAFDSLLPGLTMWLFSVRKCHPRGWSDQILFDFLNEPQVSMDFPPSSSSLSATFPRSVSSVFANLQGNPLFSNKRICVSVSPKKYGCNFRSKIMVICYRSEGALCHPKELLMKHSQSGD